VVGLHVGDPGLFDTGIKDILRQHRRLVLSQSQPLRRTPGGSVLALIVQASPDELGSLTGRLGMLPTVRVKSVLL
jgi:hypothetical protein